ncbi:MAG: carbohydrate kinase family protein [Chloroflexi bacterium]|nr:carbohydrate kinase family protein [Chloroflexota bacterium]
MSSPNSTRELALVIGAAGLDVVARLQGNLQMSTSNPSLIRTSFGGVARNVAENLARLGQPVNLLSVIGKDRIGEDVLAYTRNSGVDVSAVYATDTYPTGFYMGVLNEHGTRQFAFDDMRIMDEMTEAYLVYNEFLFEKSAMIFLDANLPEAALKKTFALAHKYKVPVCADPTSGTLAARLKPYLRQIKIIVPNNIEAGILTGCQFEAGDREAGLDAARALVNLGVEMAFITLAEYGLCYATSETNGHIPAIRTSIGDPTGAGDAFSAAVIYAIMNEIEIDDAARLGVSAASLALRYPGTVYPDLSLQKLYDELAI